MTIISLFSGAGGLDLGLIQAGNNIIWANDIDADAVATYISDTERKLVKGQYRPNQARFRREVLAAYGRCVITNVEMPEVLEAAHIVPFKYHGEDTIANGFPMRMDIHYLFDAGHLRISVDGDVFLSDKARWSYGASIPPRIFIPDQINRDFLKWRWDNYNGV